MLWQARRDYARLLACGTNALFLYVVIAAAWFQPWYLIWPITLAAVMAGTWFTPLLIAMSFSACFLELVQSYRYNWDWINTDWRATAAIVLVTVYPSLLMWCFGLLEFRSWHFDVPRRLRTATEPPGSTARS